MKMGLMLTLLLAILSSGCASVNRPTQLPENGIRNWDVEADEAPSYSCKDMFAAILSPQACLDKTHTKVCFWNIAMPTTLQTLMSGCAMRIMSVTKRVDSLFALGEPLRKF